MELADLHLLPTASKRQWLRSDEGLAWLKTRLAEGISLYQMAKLLKVSDTTLSAWRKYSEIGGLIGHPKPQLPDQSRPTAYRIICGLNSKNRGTILAEYGTAEELWETPFIHRYFSSYGVSPEAYFESYLVEIRRTGRYTLSNTFTLCYAAINHKGVIKILKPTSQNAL